MYRATSLAMALFVAFVSFYSLSAQKGAIADEPTNSLLAKLAGTWQPSEVNVNGQSSKAAASQYGPSVFAGNTWTMQTTNGDHVYRLSSVNQEADPIEVTFVEEGANRDFVGLIHLDGETLEIARGMQWTIEDGKAHIPRPDSLSPGRDKMVYTWKRSSVSTDRAKRPTLAIRLYEEGKPVKTLVDCNVESHFGGKLDYKAVAKAAEIQSRAEAFGRRPYDPITVGTRITGSIEEVRDGEMSISVEIYLGNAVSTDEPETQIVRTESLVLRTKLKAKEKKRINCGGDRWCDLMLQ